MKTRPLTMTYEQAFTILLRGLLGSATESELLEYFAPVDQENARAALAEMVEAQQVERIQADQETIYRWNYPADYAE